MSSNCNSFIKEVHVMIIILNLSLFITNKLDDTKITQK